MEEEMMKHSEKEEERGNAGNQMENTMHIEGRQGGVEAEQRHNNSRPFRCDLIV